jgi:multiple sugar transport system permease protein
MKKTAFTPGKSVIAVFALIFVIFFIGPIVWVIWGSVHIGGGGFSFSNFDRLIHYGEGLGRYFFNSCVIVLITVVGSLAISILGGYAFNRLQFKGRQVLFVGILAILMVPNASLLIPLFIWLNKIHLGNSLLGVGLVLIMYQMPFSIFMMKNAFEAVPHELDEAAMIDGCSRFSSIYRVLLPAVMPGVITVGIFAFLTGWNDFVTSLILLNDGNKFTIPLALVNLVQGVFGSIDFGALQAGVVISAAPCLLLFFVLQRYFVGGFTAGAVKG